MIRVRRQAHRRTWLGAAVVAFVALAAWLSTVSIDGLPWSSPFQVRLIVPSDAPLLHPGDDVRIGGERVGQVQSVVPGTATLALGTGRVGAGGSARVRPHGLAGAVYVDLLPGDTAHPLASGSVIHAAAGVQVTDVVSGFDADARRALTLTLTGYAPGLAGRGVAVGHVIEGAPRLLHTGAGALNALRPAPGVLERDIADSTALTGALSEAQALPSLVDASATVLSTTGAHAADVGATISALPSLEQATALALPGADALLNRLTGASSTLEPWVAALSNALPNLLALERTAPAIAALRQIASAAGGTLAGLRPALGRLTGPASGLTPLSTPAAELAAVLIPYRTELVQAPEGFTRWGNFTYDFGTGAGHRAVRFSMVMTCAHARDPYPPPGRATKERSPCP